MSYTSIFIKTDTCFYRPFKLNKQARNPKTAFHSDLPRLPPEQGKQIRRFGLQGSIFSYWRWEPEFPSSNFR